MEMTPEQKQAFRIQQEAAILAAQKHILGVAGQVLAQTGRLPDGSPPWIAQMLAYHSQEPVTQELLENVQSAGGTNHPDPTLHSMGGIDNNR